MKIDGSCFCGEIRFEANVDPHKMTICHCTDCQRMSGSAFRTIIPAAREAFKLIAGTPKKFIKTADSGNRRANFFCTTCGTSIFSCAEDDTSSPLAIRAGTVTQRDQLPPRRQIWRQSSQSWLGDIATLPGPQRQS